MNNIAKKTLLLVYIIGLVLCAGFLLVTNYFKYNIGIEIDNKYIVTLSCAFIIGIVKLCNRGQPKKSLSFYKKSYSEIIKNSFEDNKRNQRKLLKALSYYNFDKYNKSITCLRSLLPYCKTNAEKYSVNLFLALNHSDAGDTNAAIEIYKAMIDKGMADSRVFSNLSLKYSDIGDFEKAEKTCNRALSYDSKNYNAYNNLASFAFRNGNYDLSIEYAKKCLNIKNDVIQAIKLLYIIYSLIDNNEEAEIYKRKAIANGVSKKELQDSLDQYMYS